MKISEELIELWDEAQANKQCRDVCVASIFKAKRAIQYAKKYIQLDRQFWRMVRETYPEFSAKTISFNPANGTISTDDT